MLKRLHLRNFTVFEDADFEFGPGLNVIVGANGTGKSHVLKAGYALESTFINTISRQLLLFPEMDDNAAHSRLADTSNRFNDVFLPRGLPKLVRHRKEKGEAKAAFTKNDLPNLTFIIGADGSHENRLKSLGGPIMIGQVSQPVFIPAKEMLSMMPDIIGLSDKYSGLLDATYTDLARLLLVPILRQTPPYLRPALKILERSIQGGITSESGRFYLSSKLGERFDISLVAEGHRKLGTLAFLLANGNLGWDTTLFWDEPEANLNPALLKEMAAVLAELAKAGFQIILATHSLFLLKELHILSRREQLPLKYFGLSAENGGATQVATADALTDLPNIVALDAEMAQSDTFLDVLNQEDAGV